VAPGRFPIHNSMPAVLRKGMNAWKRQALRMGQTEKISRSASRPTNGRAVREMRRVCQADHARMARSVGRRAGLTRATIAEETQAEARR